MSLRPTVEADASCDQSRRARQADRFAARHILWRESTLARVRECGAVGVMLGGSVAVKASGTVFDGSRRAGFGGLSTCGSTWSCPVCSARIATHRALELGAAVQAWHDRGGRVAMVTLTQRHAAGQALADLWSANGYAWGAVTAGRGWVDDVLKYGVHGWVRVVEVTHGRNGWHVHVHALVFIGLGSALSDWRDASDAEDLGASMFQRWRAALLRKDMAAPLARSGGLDVRMVGRDDAVNLGDYFAKNTYRERSDAAGVGFEVAAGSQKTARQDNRTPFGILRDVVEVGDAADLALWHEWEAGSHGRRQLTWSRGLRADLLAAEPELTDGEVVEVDQGGEVVALVTAAGWRMVCARRLDGEVLAAAQEDDSGDAVREFLTAHGIEWDPPLTR